MALNKLTYVDNVTVIPASNLNAIQDEIIANGTNVASAKSEVENIRVGADGTTYDTAGEAVRTQIENLYDAFTWVNVEGINLYDDSDPTIINGFLGTSGLSAGQIKFSSSPAAKCLVIPVEPSTQYTLSSNGTGRFTIGLYTQIPSANDIGTLLTGGTTDQGRKHVTFTTGEDSAYCVMYYYNANDGIAEATIRATVMLAKGDIYTPYYPYQTPSEILQILKTNLNADGTAGQVLALGNDGESLIWNDPSGGQVGTIYDTPELGAELLPSSGWTTDGWTGDFTNGFTHTTGNTNPLSVTISALETNSLYQFKITTSNAATNGWSDFSVSLGGSDTFMTYIGGGASVSYTYGIFCGSTKVLTITPRNDYTGTVTGLSLKKVINEQNALTNLHDSNDVVTSESRTSLATKNSIYQGVNAGKYAFWGYENTAIGDNALSKNTSGFWNTAVGRRALESNQNGSRNVAIGYIALLRNTGGDRNVAIGTFALEKNTTGRYNIALNADALQDNTTGSRNIGIGVRACVGNTTGNNNIGVGDSAVAANQTGSGNIGIGHNALTNVTGSHNVAIGNEAGDVSGMTGSNNILLGYGTDVPTAGANNQMVLGNSNISTVVIAGKTINFNQDGSVTWS